MLFRVTMGQQGLGAVGKTLRNWVDSGEELPLYIGFLCAEVDSEAEGWRWPNGQDSLELFTH